MRLKDDDIRDYIRLHKETEGEDISFEEADEIVHRMLDLFLLLLEPLPPVEKHDEAFPIKTCPVIPK